MADSLLSPAVGLSMCALSAGAVAYSARKVGQDKLAESKVPLMAVTGAFIFAAQMINFAIPGTGSSGHIGGGIMIAAILGGFPGLLCLTSVLLIQAFFFADGGLIALGCNVFNIGVIPCLLIYPLVFRPLFKKRPSGASIAFASVLSCVLSLQLGAFAVVLQTFFSGVTALPLSSFLLLMQPIHLAIGVFEGGVTAAVLCFVFKARPELFENRSDETSLKQPLIALGALTLIVAGLLSLFASRLPDGLEWSIARVANSTLLPASRLLEASASLQQNAAPLPDYALKSGGGESLSGVLGALLTFALAGGTSLLIRSLKKRRSVKK